MELLSIQTNSLNKSSYQFHYRFLIYQLIPCQDDNNNDNAYTFFTFPSDFNSRKNRHMNNKNQISSRHGFI